MRETLLTTDRLELREFGEEDWQAVHEYAVDEEVLRYMEWGPNTEQETREFIQRAIDNGKAEPRGHCELAVCLRGENQLIGGFGLPLGSRRPRARRWSWRRRPLG